MNKLLLSTYTKHAAATLDKQIHLNGMIDGLEFEYRQQPGEIAFGDEYVWNTQVLGTESESTSTWLWGWANGASGVLDESLVMVRKLQKLGKDQGIEELVTPEIPFEEFDGNFWSVIGTGLCNAAAYFRIPNADGALYVAIKDANFKQNTDRSLARLATVFPQAIAAFPMKNHISALKGYVDYLGLKIGVEGKGLFVADDSGGRLVAQFDERKRLAKLKGSLAKAEDSGK